MHTAAALGGWHALEAVAAGFIVEEGKIGAGAGARSELDLEDDALKAGAGRLPGGMGGQSAEAAEMADIGLGKLAHEETCVVTTLGGADFEQAFHGLFS